MFNDVLDVCWVAGFTIPVVNEQNKELQEEVQRKQRELLNIDSKLNKHKNATNDLTEHLRNLKQAVSDTETLIKVREKETESHEHHRALAERETGRLKQEITHLDKEMKTLVAKKNA